MGFGFNEILLVLVLVFFLFGPKKIPELLRGLGRGMREFNDAKANVRREIEEGLAQKDRNEAASVNGTTKTTEL